MKLETIVGTYIVLCLVMLAALMVAAPAKAANTEMTLSWTPPDSRVDGSPLDPATELSGYELTCGDVTTPIPATSPSDGHPVPKADALPGYGSYDCSLVAIDLEGRRSSPSEPVVVEWVAGPSAPTSLIIFYGPN